MTIEEMKEYPEGTRFKREAWYTTLNFAYIQDDIPYFKPKEGEPSQLLSNINCSRDDWITIDKVKKKEKTMNLNELLLRDKRKKLNHINSKLRTGTL